MHNINATRVALKSPNANTLYTGCALQLHPIMATQHSAAESLTASATADCNFRNSCCHYFLVFFAFCVAMEIMFAVNGALRIDLQKIALKLIKRKITREKLKQQQKSIGST